MDGLRPISVAEPGIPESVGSGVLRTIIYGVLSVMLLGAAWVRFNDQIGSLAPALAAPAAGVAGRVADSGRIKGLMELALLPSGATAEALGSLQLPTGEAEALAAAVRHDQARLVRLPLFDASDVVSDGSGIGQAVEVSSGGYTRIVRLTRQPVIVTLPISRAGTVSFRTADAEGVGIGALTLNGPVRLPDLSAGQVLSVGIVAQ